jgi:DNA replication protein DnaC
MLTLKKAQEKTSEAIFASNEQRAAKIKIGYQSVNGRLIEVDFLGIEGSRDESGARTVILKHGSCKMCNGQMGYLFPEGADFMFSCFSCFESETEKSKKLAKEIYLKKLEKPPELNLIEDFKLGKRLESASFENWHYFSYVELVKKWLLASKTRQQKDFLVFKSAAKKGKTYFCAAILNHFSKEGNANIFYTETPKLFSRIKQKMEVSNSYETINFYKNHPFLIIDGVGSDLNTEWQQDILSQILKHRFNDLLPTVLTTSISESDSEKVFTKTLISYIYDKNNTNINGKW